MKPDILTPRALNRATLARQMLLAREAVPPTAAIERQFAMQAQLARPPFIGLWSRVANFEREALNEALHRREVVRSTSLRCTLHLMSARDYQQFRATIQPVLDYAMRAVLKARGEIPPLEGLLAIARDTFEAAPQTFDALRDVLLQHHPDADERAMGYAVRTQLPLVQVPTDATWGFPGASEFTTSSSWLGAAPTEAADLPGLVRRYLAAFGPASVTDMQTWSGLAKLRGVFDALRPELLVFKDERGRELFDLPEAPRPGEDAAAPVRFLPDYDSLVLGHDDRSRLIADAHRPLIFRPNLRILATFLVDGRVAGTWKLEGTKTKAVLALSPFEPLAADARDALAEEGDRLLRFAEPAAKSHTLRFD